MASRSKAKKRRGVIDSGAAKRSHPLRSTREGYASGERTRSKIIEVAIAIFADCGFQAASTRAIARRAGVNLAALQYYFGGKEGLYKACAEHISEHVRETLIGPITESIERALIDPTLSREHLLELLRSIVDMFCDHLLDKPEPMHWALFVIRGANSPRDATVVVSEKILQTYVHTVAKLIGRLSDSPADDPVILLRAFFTVTNFQSFLSLRDTVLRMMKWKGFNSDRIDMIKTAMWRQTLSTFLPDRNL